MNQEFLFNESYVNKGFILDLPIDAYWSEAILSGKLHLPCIDCRYFTHLIELHYTEE